MPAGARSETHRHPTPQSQDLDGGFHGRRASGSFPIKRADILQEAFLRPGQGPAARQEWRTKTAFRDGATASHPVRVAQQREKRLAESGIVPCGKYSSTCRRVLNYSPQSTPAAPARRRGPSGTNEPPTHVCRTPPARTPTRVHRHAAQAGPRMPFTG